MREQTTVFVVDDDRAMLNSLKWLLESAGHNVETFASSLAFLEQADSSISGWLLLDIRMPDMDGLQLQDRLVARGVDIPIIIISGHADVSTTVRAMKAGAIDLIEKPFDDQKLLDRIGFALNIEDVRRDRRYDLQRISRRVKRLTPREKEVMELVVTGNSNKNIARELNISNKTVEAHRAKVMRKMKADSLASLIREIVLLPS